MQRLAPVILAATLILAPLGARTADLVVWWEKGFYPREDEAVAEIVSTFEQDTSKKLDLVQPSQAEIQDKAESALAAGRPPDFLFSTLSQRWIPRWAYEGRFTDLEAVLGPVLGLFDADAIEVSRLLNGNTSRRGLYALPMGRVSNHIHVWNSLLKRAAFTLGDIPKDWAAFWSFWCDQVQPAVRRVTGRKDIWGIGLPMSVAATGDTADQLVQFQLAYEAPWIGLDRRLQVDDPKIREGMIKALNDYAAIWRKGCTPRGAVRWTNIDNNKAFLAQTVVMTVNTSLSVPAALRAARPDDYYENAATIDWPDSANDQPLVLVGFVQRAVVFKAGRNPALASDFVRFLAEEGWLAHWLTFAGDRMVPPIRKLVEQPFWLDPNDPHRMRSAMQSMTRPHLMHMDVRDNEWRSTRIWDENVWGNAVHRVAADGISPEQAVDEAIARIKQILAE
jgi:multiple sugar transport system substrate-binding protein